MISNVVVLKADGRYVGGLNDFPLLERNAALISLGMLGIGTLLAAIQIRNEKKQK